MKAPGRRDGALRDLAFGAIRTARQFLDGGAIEIARGKIHVLVAAVGGKRVIDEADVLEQVLPVDVRDQAQAGDDVAHGDAGGALPPMDLANHDVGARALRRQTLVEPGQRGGDGRVLIAQPVDELDGEGIREDVVLHGWRARPSRDRRSSAGAQQPVGEIVGLTARRAARDDLFGEAAQVLDHARCAR